jgi:fibronectin-binding autotransporter adhesin
MRLPVLGVLAMAAGLCAPLPAQAQVYTWRGTNSTDFNDTTNWGGASAPTFPSSGTFVLVTGTLPANMPQLTVSTTIGSLWGPYQNAAPSGTLAFTSSSPSNVLTLTSTGRTYYSAVTFPGNETILNLGVNVHLAPSASGTQSFRSDETTIFSGTISGGAADRILLIEGGNGGGNISFTNSGNSFSSMPVIAGISASFVARPTVPVLGMAGSNSSLGTSGTIRFGDWARIYTGSSTPAQTTDKTFELAGTTNASYVGINAGPFSGLYSANYPGVSAVNLTGPVRTLSAGISGTNTSRFWLGMSGTASGLISDADNHRLEVASYGVVLTNANNTFRGGFVAASQGTVPVTQFGMIGSPSVIGSGSMITIGTGTGYKSTLQYTGAGETSDKRFALVNNANSAQLSVLDASGSGELVLSNTSAFSAAASGAGASVGLELSGTSRGALAASLTNIGSGTTLALWKTGAGTWRLTGSTSYTGVTTVNGGVLRLDAAAALPGGIGPAASGPASNLTLAGGVIGLANGDFQRTIGTGTHQVQWSGTGGFAAYGQDRAVNFGGANAQVTAGSGFLTQTLVLGANDAPNKITVTNPIDLGGAARAIRVDGTAVAELSGVLSGVGSSGLTKSGSGALVLSAANTHAGTTTVNGGILRLANAAPLAGPVTLSGGTMRFDVDATLPGNVSVGTAAGSVLDLAGRTTTFSGTVSGVDSTGGLINVTAGTATIARLSGTTQTLSLGGGVLTVGMDTPQGTGTGIGLATIDLGGSGTLNMYTGGAGDFRLGAFTNAAGGQWVKQGPGYMSVPRGTVLPTLTLAEGNLGVAAVGTSGTLTEISRTGRSYVSVVTTATTGVFVSTPPQVTNGAIPWAAGHFNGTFGFATVNSGSFGLVVPSGTIPRTGAPANDTSGTNNWTTSFGTTKTGTIGSLNAYTLATNVDTGTLSIGNYLRTNAILVPNHVSLTVAASGSIVIPGGSGDSKELTIWRGMNNAVASNPMVTFNTGIVEESPNSAVSLQFVSSSADANAGSVFHTLALNGPNNFTGPLVVGGMRQKGDDFALTIGDGQNLNSTVGDINVAEVTTVAPLTINTGGTSTVGSITSVAGATPYLHLLKTGSGVLRITGTAGTYTGTTGIVQGVVEVARLANAGVASSLGAATGANATINLGGTAASLVGTLRYVGTTSATTDRVFNLSGTAGGGGVIEASGLGALVITSTVTSADSAKSLTLAGTSTAANEIRSIRNPTTGNVSVVKDGPGLWRLTGTSGFAGGVTVKNGTLVAGVDTNGGTGAGVFGTSDTVIVGDESSGAAGTASLLLAPGVSSYKLLRVPATTGTQTVVLGGEAVGATPSFENQIRLGRDVTLVAATSGTTSFGNFWYDASGTASPTANVTIGSAGRAGTVRLANSLTTTGSVAVRFGTLDVLDARTLSASGIVGIDGNATLAGVGRVAATLGGAGLVAPGNSPGILTADAVNPTGGLDWAFEFTGASPDYGNASASINDVLRLTGTASSPFTTPLTSANEIAVYLDVASLAEGNTFSGGFFTNLAGDFRSSIADAAYTYWVSGTGAGQTTYLSKTYVPLATAYPSLSMDVTTVATTATFSGEPATSGQVTTFTVVVPEPGAIALAALGLGLAGYARRRSRRHQARSGSDGTP